MASLFGICHKLHINTISKSGTLVECIDPFANSLEKNKVYEVAFSNNTFIYLKNKNEIGWGHFGGFFPSRFKIAGDK